MLAFGQARPDPAAAAPPRKARAAPPPTDPDRRAAVGIALARTGLARWATDLDTIRGQCRARKCGSRWGIVRVTLDFRPVTIERFAHVECARCGRVWRRTRVQPLRTRRGWQRVAVTAILPASSRRWYARGRWHREGDDALVVAECSLSDLDDAARAHRALRDRVEAVKARRKALRDRLEAEAMVKYRATMAAVAEMDARHRAEREDAA